MRGHGRRGDAEALGECKPGDAGTIAADAGVVREQAAHTDLQCEAERRGSAERADDDDVARADITGAAGDRVENDDAAAGIVIDGTQGAPSRARPLSLRRRGVGSSVRAKDSASLGKLPLVTSAM